MKLQDIAAMPFEEFEGRLEALTVADLVHHFREDLGVEFKTRPLKKDTLRAAYDAVQAKLSDSPASEGAPQEVATPSVGEGSTEAGEARFLCRSKTGKRRLRGGHEFPGDSFMELPESEISDAVRADPYIELREIK